MGRRTFLHAAGQVAANELMMRRALLNYTTGVEDAGAKVSIGCPETLEAVLAGVPLLQGIDVDHVIAGEQAIKTFAASSELLCMSSLLDH